jgi:hypothetical protein
MKIAYEFKRALGRRSLLGAALSVAVASAACQDGTRTVADTGVGGGSDSATPPADVPDPLPPDANRATPIESIPGHENVAQDTTPKRGPRMLPVETYIRSYLQLFAGAMARPTQTPLQVQTDIRARDATLFDTWNDYLASMGLPDHRVDINRNTQTSPLMLATLERTGIALCDVTVANELDAMTPTPMANRRVFAFDQPAGALDLAGFRTRFDVLHRTFLGYPASLAPDNRAQRFFTLYQTTVARFSAATGAPATTFRLKSSTGWAAVCYALIRHPEFQMY